MSPSHRPNIILMSSHDIGRRLGCYGITEARTPHLDTLAAEGTRFTESFTPQSQCSPARAAMLTGRYPHSNGVMGLSHSVFKWNMYDGEVHLANRLKVVGYQARLAGLQHEVDSRETPLETIFDKHERRTPWAEGNVDVAIEYMDEMTQDDAPFYLQIGFFEGHRVPGHERHEFGPMDPLDPAAVTVPAYIQDTPEAREELSQLDGSVASMDEQIGRLLQYLDDNNLRDNTLVIFTVDHGIPFTRAKTSSYDPGHEVALIWRGPQVPVGQSIDGLVSHIDCVPSLIDYLGLPMDERLEGESYWSNIFRGSSVEKEAIYFEMTQHNSLDVMRAIRTSTHKLIVNFVSTACVYDSTQQWVHKTLPVVPGMRGNNNPPAHTPVELYDIVADPNEMHDLAESDKHQDVKRDLLDRLFVHLQVTDDPVLAGIPTPPSWHEAMHALRGTAALQTV